MPKKCTLLAVVALQRTVKLFFHSMHTVMLQRALLRKPVLGLVSLKRSSVAYVVCSGIVWVRVP